MIIYSKLAKKKQIKRYHILYDAPRDFIRVLYLYDCLFESIPPNML